MSEKRKEEIEGEYKEIWKGEFILTGKEVDEIDKLWTEWKELVLNE